jgi:hypothetical protein
LVGGELVDGGSLLSGQGSAQDRFALTGEAGGGRFHLGSALGELPDQPVGDACDFGSAVVVDLAPGDSEATAVASSRR